MGLLLLRPNFDWRKATKILIVTAVSLYLYLLLGGGATQHQGTKSKSIRGEKHLGFVMESWPPGASRRAPRYLDYSAADSFLLAPGCRRPTADWPPSARQMSVLVGVQSAPGNFASRSEVRRTWAGECRRNGGPSSFMPCDYFFSLGTTREVRDVTGGLCMTLAPKNPIYRAPFSDRQRSFPI